MNTANLQLQGLYLTLASLVEALAAKGVLSRAEIDLALARAEQIALGDERAAEDFSLANRDALAFPARFLRLANSEADGAGPASFSALARLVGQTKGHYPDEL